jgi:hypothetical protein
MNIKQKQWQSRSSRWLWKDMKLNIDLLNHLYNNIFSNYYMFKKERSVPVPVIGASGKNYYINPHTLWNVFNNIP